MKSITACVLGVCVICALPFIVASLFFVAAICELLRLARRVSE